MRYQTHANWRNRVSKPVLRELPPVIHASEMPPADISSGVRHGVLAKIAPAMYILRNERSWEKAGASGGADHDSTGPIGVQATQKVEQLGNERHLADELERISAAQRFTSSAAVFSHGSAAAIWGLPTFGTRNLPHISGTAKSNAGTSWITWHRVEVDPAQIVRWGGLFFTSLERTVVDCLRLLSPFEGLAVADAAMRVGLNRSEALVLNAKIANPRFRARADALLQFCELGAESPGESKLRLCLGALGWPDVELQTEVSTPHGRYYLDLADTNRQIAFEFDGMVKYQGSALRIEKVREQHLRARGWHVERFTWAELNDFSKVSARLRRLAADRGAVLVNSSLHQHVQREMVRSARKRW